MKEDQPQKHNFFLSSSVLVFSGTQIILFALFPVLSDRLSIPLTDIILIFSLGTILFLFGSPFWASESDERGRKKIISVGLLGLAISFAIIALLYIYPETFNHTWTLTLLLLSRLVYGLVASAIVPVSQLARKDLAQKDSHLSSMFSHSLALSLGRVLGPLLLLLMSSKLQVLLVGLSILPVVIILFFHKEEVQQSVHNVQSYSWLDMGQKIKLPITVTILFTTYIGTLHSSLAHRIENLFSLSGTDAGQLMAKVLLMGSFLMTLTQLSGKIFLRNHVRGGFFLGLFILTLGAALLSFMQSRSELWTAIAFISIGIALFQPSHLAIVHELFPLKNAGKQIGILASGNTLGYGLGGVFSALLLGPHIYHYALLIILPLIIMGTVNALEVRS